MVVKKSRGPMAGAEVAAVGGGEGAPLKLTIGRGHHCSWPLSRRAPASPAAPGHLRAVEKVAKGGCAARGVGKLAAEGGSHVPELHSSGKKISYRFQFSVAVNQPQLGIVREVVLLTRISRALQV